MKSALTLISLAILALSTGAQTIPVPNAGSIQQQQIQRAPVGPEEVDGIQYGDPLVKVRKQEEDADAAYKAAEKEMNAEKFRLSGVSFDGVVSLDKGQFKAVGDLAGAVIGREISIFDLARLANGVTEIYKKAGFPFATATVGEQEIKAGDDSTAVITVTEGKYGLITVESKDGAFGAGALPYVSQIKRGQAIRNEQLEAVVGSLQALPGVVVSPTISAGRSDGEGDLVVGIEHGANAYEVGYSNAGTRYTGLNQVHLNADLNSPFSFGDQLKLSATSSDEKLTVASIGYSIPVGINGTRVNVGYSQTDYALIAEFASLKAHGSAKNYSGGFTTPLIRSPGFNLSASGTYQLKDMADSRDAVDSNTWKRSESLPLAMSFDMRSPGSLTYGSVSYTAGTLDMDAGSTSADMSSTKGTYSKVNVELINQEAFGAGWSSYLRLSGQSAQKNLDSSESFTVGGPSGVRAYGIGEATGDTGYVLSGETRVDLGNGIQPYAFYDAGFVRTKEQPTEGIVNERMLSGYGVGVRYADGGLSIDLAMAWRLNGGTPTAGGTGVEPTAWLTGSYRW